MKKRLEDMKKNVGRPKRGKSTLTHEKIIETAMKMVDAQGIEAFSMRKLAAELRVDPMAIYYYFKNKQSILQELIKVALDFSDLKPMDCSEGEVVDWKDAVKNFARYYVGLCRKHPKLVQYLVINPKSGTESIQAGNEILFSALLSGGFSSQTIIRVTDVIIDYLNGFTFAESSGMMPDNEQRTQEFRASMVIGDEKQYPVTRKIIEGIEGEIATDFEIGLDFILAGVKVLYEENGNFLIK